MIRKTLLRLLRLAAVFVGLLFTSLCVAGFLAVQEPAFYARLRNLNPTPADVEAVTDRLQLERSAYLEWRSRVRAGQQNGQAPTAHEVRFSSAQLNSLLAAETQSMGGGAVQDPRVRITPGLVEVACGIQTPAARFVLSAAMSPALTPEGVLTLELESARLGWLPLPCDTLLGFFPREEHRLSGKLYLDLTATKPRVTLDLSDKAQTLMAESIDCGAGEVSIHFIAAPDRD